MIQLGFVSAILPDLPLEEILVFASEVGYDCIEVMCWPPSKADRRYAGVTHIDVESMDAKSVRNLVNQSGVALSGLGYYPNCLAPDPIEAKACVEHLVKVIEAAARLELTRVNTFIGRNPLIGLEENWPRMLETWAPLVRLAEKWGVKIGIENCPMYFSQDEWPGGKNLATSPAIWRRLFRDLDSQSLGLNYDPSHMLWQRMDYVAPLREFSDRLFHLHAKDVRVDQVLLDSVGILAHPSTYHVPKLPGLGQIDWGSFFSTLTDVGYRGAICVEVEDREYEGSLEDRKDAIRQSFRYLRQFV